MGTLALKATSQRGEELVTTNNNRLFRASRVHEAPHPHAIYEHHTTTKPFPLSAHLIAAPPSSPPHFTSPRPLPRARTCLVFRSMDIGNPIPYLA